MPAPMVESRARQAPAGKNFPWPAYAVTAMTLRKLCLRLTLALLVTSSAIMAIALAARAMRPRAATAAAVLLLFATLLPHNDADAIVAGAVPDKPGRPARSRLKKKGPTSRGTRGACKAGAGWRGKTGNDHPEGHRARWEREEHPDVPHYGIGLRNIRLTGCEKVPGHDRYCQAAVRRAGNAGTAR